MKVDLWIEVTEDNIERLTDLYTGIFPNTKGRVALGNYANYDPNYSSVQARFDIYESTTYMLQYSRLVDIDEFMLTVFEDTLNQ